jgi:hypothetical protein
MLVGPFEKTGLRGGQQAIHVSQLKPSDLGSINKPLVKVFFSLILNEIRNVFARLPNGKLQSQTMNPYQTEASLLNKSSCLAPTLCATKLTNVRNMGLFTLCCAT